MVTTVRAERRATDSGRARQPDTSGEVERDGVRLHYEAFGAGGPAVMLLPTYPVIHSRMWKAQTAFLARHCRVITYDGRGNGRSDRPVGPEAYAPAECAADVIAVMDAVAVPSATLVALSCGASWATITAAEHPDRVEGIVYIGPAVDLAPGHPEREVHSFLRPLDTDEGWAKDNIHYWRRDYAGYLEFFFAQCLPEPHSTKQLEDCIGWGLETSAATLIDASLGNRIGWREPLSVTCARVRCPTLVIHGDADRIRPLGQGAALAQATGGQLVVLEGAGHLPMARDPVKVNELLRAFICPPPVPRRWPRAAARRPRALFISSPIGLGHARRDLAIAAELRRQRPGLEVDWLAQHPVTVMLQEAGERVHPASRHLAGESAHMAAEARGHELRCFEALRRMDEILLANFMVFRDVVREEAYDLWIGDEAWELDHFLHENPELKSAPYVWLSDFVGMLPMPGGGEREARLTADVNAEMLTQRARFPWVRDRSIFIGEPADIVPDTFGPGLPPIRPWTERNFDFCGYVLPAGDTPSPGRGALRAELGYEPEEKVCLVAVGGSGVGHALLERAAAAQPHAAERVPGLRMVLVAGPRIDPSSLDVPDGVEVRAYVPRLDRHLAACDLAVVQGGLATTMELAAAGRPFLYFPLTGHFEQCRHVAHRLDRYGAGRRVDLAGTPPEALGAAIAEEVGRVPAPAPVRPGAAARAAAMIAEVL